MDGARAPAATLADINDAGAAVLSQHNHLIPQFLCFAMQCPIQSAPLRIYASLHLASVSLFFHETYSITSSLYHHRLALHLQISKERTYPSNCSVFLFLLENISTGTLFKVMPRHKVRKKSVP